VVKAEPGDFNLEKVDQGIYRKSAPEADREFGIRDPNAVKHKARRRS
jgi:hypothetical protein